MVVEDQTEALEYLGSPAAHGGAAVERIETHSAVVFLAGDHAWKVKRAVRYDYLDFSTLERRQRACEAELALNRRTAPSVYEAVVPVTREANGRLTLGGAGTPLEWAVRMRRFDQEALFDRLADRGALALDTCTALAAELAAFYRNAARRDELGGAAAIEWVVAGNAAGLAEHASDILDAETCATLVRDTRAALARQAATLDRRRDAGFVRQCHGDLHLRNIVLLDGRPTLFDAVEFDDRIACVDVLYDLAFLLMDLWRRRLARHANVVLNGYLRESADYSGLALLPLFLSCRAAIRAKTSATAAGLVAGPTARRELEEASRDYVAMAQALLRPSGPAVIAIGGLSGAGKSTQALALAPDIGPVPGAVVLRSDEVRKALCGVSPLTPLPAEAYTREMSERVYARLIEIARLVAQSGQAVVVDAVFAAQSERDAVESAARALAVPFHGLWLEASEGARLRRVERRTSDASDADTAVARRQAELSTGDVRWPRVDADASSDAVEMRVRRALRVLPNRPH